MYFSYGLDVRLVDQKCFSLLRLLVVILLLLNHFIKCVIIREERILPKWLNITQSWLSCLVNPTHIPKTKERNWRKNLFHSRQEKWRNLTHGFNFDGRRLVQRFVPKHVQVKVYQNMKAGSLMTCEWLQPITFPLNQQYLLLLMMMIQRLNNIMSMRSKLISSFPSSSLIFGEKKGEPSHHDRVWGRPRLKEKSKGMMIILNRPCPMRKIWWWFWSPRVN